MDVRRTGRMSFVTTQPAGRRRQDGTLQEDQLGDERSECGRGGPSDGVVAAKYNPR
jgi:hypothetical protein